MAEERGRTACGEPPDASFVDLARAKFGYDMALAVVGSATKKALGGRRVLPRKGGARLYVTSGMLHGATQGLGGWRSPKVMVRGYDTRGSDTGRQ